MFRIGPPSEEPSHDGAPVPGDPEAFHLTSPAAIHLCPCCHQPRLQLIDTLREPHGVMRMLIRCPDCDWVHEGRFLPAQVFALADRNDEAADEMLAAMMLLQRAQDDDLIDRLLRDGR